MTTTHTTPIGAHPPITPSKFRLPAGCTIRIASTRRFCVVVPRQDGNSYRVLYRTDRLDRALSSAVNNNYPQSQVFVVDQVDRAVRTMTPNGGWVPA